MKTLLMASLMLVAAGVAQAEMNPDVEQQIRTSLSAVLPDLKPDSVRETPLDGIYEVTFGTRIVYVTADGRYLLQGKLVDLTTQKSITDERLSALKLKALRSVSEDDMVIYGPKDARYTVTVFTDIDCGFCRKLHSQIAEYNKDDIRIRYLFYPRAGVGSDSYDKAVSVWCSDDRKKAMDAAKAGSPIEAKTCANPVAEQHALGEAMNVQGTPALVLDDGEMVPGYVPPDKLREMLDQHFSKQGS